MLWHSYIRRWGLFLLPLNLRWHVTTLTKRVWQKWPRASSRPSLLGDWQLALGPWSPELPCRCLTTFHREAPYGEGLRPHWDWEGPSWAHHPSHPHWGPGHMHNTVLEPPGQSWWVPSREAEESPSQALPKFVTQKIVKQNNKMCVVLSHCALELFVTW